MSQKGLGVRETVLLQDKGTFAFSLGTSKRELEERGRGDKGREVLGGVGDKEGQF